VLVGGVLAYNRLGGSPEVNRDRALKKAQEYLSQAKVNKTIIEYKNALHADPGSPEAHYEFGLALLKQQEFRTAYTMSLCVLRT
jgi:cytochrome c-type biogenesis protein CcmH/NrfG